MIVIFPMDGATRQVISQSVPRRDDHGAVLQTRRNTGGPTLFRHPGHVRRQRRRFLGPSKMASLPYRYPRCRPREGALGRTVVPLFFLSSVFSPVTSIDERGKKATHLDLTPSGACRGVSLVVGKKVVSIKASS